MQGRKRKRNDCENLLFRFHAFGHSGLRPRRRQPRRPRLDVAYVHARQARHQREPWFSVTHGPRRFGRPKPCLDPTRGSRRVRRTGLTRYARQMRVEQLGGSASVRSRASGAAAGVVRAVASLYLARRRRRFLRELVSSEGGAVPIEPQ
jgi:hypothetical protein